MAITPLALFDFAVAHNAEALKEDRSNVYPSFREVAKRFKVTHDQIEQACEDWDSSQGYMGTVVGIRAGSGIAAIKHRGEYLVEAYS